MNNIQDNIDRIKTKIKKTANNWDRNTEDINLIAVSKGQSINGIKETLDTGHRLFGENKVQEAYDHWFDIKNDYKDIRLHMIGHLQTNKVKDAVALFDVIETIDSKKIAKKLSDEMRKQNRVLSCFIQVNTGDEEQKYGVVPGDLDELLNYCRGDLGLNISGLMCIPPNDNKSGMHFAFLNKLRGKYSLEELSMGMSHDYDKAIMAGATYIRVGRDLFGERESL